MTKKVRIIFLVASMLITSCSDSINPVNITETKVKSPAKASKMPAFLSAKDIAELEKEYSAFKTKSASQGYVRKKLDLWLDTANNGASIKGPQLLREVEFARMKGESEIPLKALFASVPPASLYTKVANATAITTDINAGNVPLDFFINFTVNPISQVQGTLTADTISSAGFTARWGSVAGATAYEIMINNTTTFSTTNTFYPVSITGTGHTFKVRAIKNTVPGAYSTDFNVPAIPATPTILTTDNITFKSFRANWNPVAGATSYEIKIGAAAPVSTGSSTTYTADNLAGTSQTFQVRAVKDAATGDFSTATAVTLPASTMVATGLRINLDAGTYSGSGNWNDISGNGYSATLSNSPLFNSGFGGHFQLDGINDGVILPAQFNPGANNITLSMWLKTTATAGGVFIAYNCVNAIHGQLASGKITFSARDGNSNSVATTTAANVNDGNWKYVTFQRSAGTLSIYVNGALSSSSTGPLGSVDTGSSIWLLGNFTTNACGITGNSNEAPLNAAISSFSIYNRALTTAEITQNFYVLKNRYGI